MLYSFDIQYFDQLHQHNARATVIMDLPQASLNDVRFNPFVLDIVNDPFMRDGILRVQNHQERLVDNVDNYGADVIPNTVFNVDCCYMEAPGPNRFKSFSFKIWVDVPIGYTFPTTALSFTCRGDYDAYEQLYFSDRFVVSPQIPNTQVPMANGYYYQLLLQGRIKEMLCTVDASNPQKVQMEAISRTGSVSIITLPSINRRQVCPIRLTDQLLMMVGFRFNTGNLYSLIGIEYFECLLTDHTGIQTTVYLRKDAVGYSLIVPVAGAPQNCKQMKCFHMHELQDLFWNEFNARITLPNQQLVNICVYLNNLGQCCKIIETLPTVVDSFVSNYHTQHQIQPNRNSIAAYVANYYHITNLEALHFMNVLPL